MNNFVATPTKRKTKPSKERRELFVSRERSECEAWEGYNPQKHETVFDDQTGLHSVFNKRRNRSCYKPVTRESREIFLKGRKLLITISPDETITFRLKGAQKRCVISWGVAYEQALWREAKVKHMDAKKAKAKKKLLKARR